MPDHCPGHPDPPLVIEVDLVLHRLALTPLAKLVLLVPDHTTSGAVPPLATPHSKPVEPGGVHSTVLGVEKLYPGVNLLDSLVLVNMIRWGWTIVLEPDKFRGRQQVGNNQLILDMRMVRILVINYLF